MKKLQTGAAVVLFGLTGILIFWQHRQLKQVEANNIVLRQEVAEVRQENQGLSDTRKSSDSLSQDDLRDLMRLRAQATRMYEVEQENNQLKADRDRLTRQLSQNASGAIPPEQSPEQEYLHVKMSYAKQWGLALFMSADDNNGKFPADLADATNYMSSNAVEHFSNYGMGIKEGMIELVYHGAQKDIQIPGEMILLREKLPTRFSDGRWAKVYIYCDGHVDTQVNADGDFSNWEKEHTPSEASIPASP